MIIRINKTPPRVGSARNARCIISRKSSMPGTKSTSRPLSGSIIAKTSPPATRSTNRSTSTARRIAANAKTSFFAMALTKANSPSPASAATTPASASAPTTRTPALIPTASSAPVKSATPYSSKIAAASTNASSVATFPIANIALPTCNSNPTNIFTSKPKLSTGSLATNDLRSYRQAKFEKRSTSRRRAFHNF